MFGPARERVVSEKCIYGVEQRGLVKERLERRRSLCEKEACNWKDSGK